jgi:hypothetical protein
MSILLTFDIEEFDTPLEYGFQIPFEEQISVSTQGFESLLEIVDKHHVACTFFTTANYALHAESLIKKTAQQHEIASHTYFHSSFQNSDLLKSRLALEKITEKNIVGFRMPRLAPVSNYELVQSGYRYNSSLNPTWVPGRYNHLNKPRTAFVKDNLIQIPSSVTPVLRIPLFWLSFKVFPKWWLLDAMKRTLKHDGVLSLYFHPWEFVNITSYGLPSYISNRSGNKMLQLLDESISYLKDFGNFETMNTYSSMLTLNSK